jgi:hypothetical protein
VRTNSTLRKLRPVHLGAAVAMLAIPASAVALAAGNADALSAIQITLKTAHLGFGHPVVVSGSAPGATAGAPLQLQFAPTGATRWQELSSGATRAGGRFRFVQPVRQSGLLRVVPGQAGTAPGGRAVQRHGCGSAGPECSAPGFGGGSVCRTGTFACRARRRTRPRTREAVARSGRPTGSPARPQCPGLARALHRPDRSAGWVRPAGAGQWQRTAVAAGWLQRRSAQRRQLGPCRKRDRVPPESRLLVQRRRGHGVRVPCPVRSGQQVVAVRHQGRVPGRRTVGHSGRR